MAVTASLIKELRERTGAGMMDCRKALEANNGNIEAAIEEMRKSGQAKAAKKAGRVAAEGILAIKSRGNQTVMVEVNCETDFVAREDSFKQFADAVAESALKQKSDTVEQLQNADFGDHKTVDQARTTLIAKIGENIQLRRIKYIETENNLGRYVHGAGRIAALVEIEGGDGELAKNIAMHITAMNPQAINADDVPAALLDKEKEIFSAQAQQSGKPAEIIEKMVAGRLKKFINEISLEGQSFIREPDKTVGQLLKEQQATVKQFFRFEVGEGIEKETSNFADEVKAAVQGN
ncbi:MAG: translation elongation factor Ts [Pseudomonadota bacterium]